MKLLKETQYGFIYETDEVIINYFDVFFASYNNHIIKAEKTIASKITKEKTYWRAWFTLPEDLAKAIKVDDLHNNWPPKDLDIQSRFDEWLEERLLSDNEWMADL